MRYMSPYQRTFKNPIENITGSISGYVNTFIIHENGCRIFSYILKIGQKKAHRYMGLNFILI